MAYFNQLTYRLMSLLDNHLEETANQWKYIVMGRMCKLHSHLLRSGTNPVSQSSEATELTSALRAFGQDSKLKTSCAHSEDITSPDPETHLATNPHNRWDTKKGRGVVLIGQPGVKVEEGLNSQCKIQQACNSVRTINQAKVINFCPGKKS